MSDDYMKARKAGEKEYKAKAAAGEYPFLPALDDILPDCATMAQKALGVMEIPVEMIAGTKTRARQNSFAPNFMPLLEPKSEFGRKWDSLYNAQLREGFNDPIKVYEYLHRFYVQEGNKRVSVSRYLDMPAISASVTRIMPKKEVLDMHPEYAEFLKFYDVTHIYSIEFSWAGAFAELAELLGRDLEKTWPEEEAKALKTAYWSFSEAYRGLQLKGADLPAGDAFMVYMRIYIRDAMSRHSEKVVQKRILEIQKELLTEQSSDRVALIEAEEALAAGKPITKTGIAISKVISTLAYSPKHPLKVAFIHDKTSENNNWTADHEKGRLRLENAYGGTVVTKCWDGRESSADFETAVKEAADWGAEVVFTTASRHINDTLRAAIEYKDIKFLNCSVNQVRHAVRTYYAKIYEAKFLAGMIAGVYSAADGTHKIGYRSDFTIFCTIAAINAFAIGAAMTDPSAKVYLEWSEKEGGSNWWWSMVDRGINVISAVDSAHNTDGSSAFGLCYVERVDDGSGNDLSHSCRITNLAAPISKKGKHYEIIVKTILEGTYNAGSMDIKDRATNYWWGMISGVVDIELSDELPLYTRQLVKALRSDIIHGSFTPFDGELRSQEGVVRKQGDRGLSSLEIIEMDWLCENIVGEIPVIDTFTEEAKGTVKVSGIEKSKAAPGGNRK